MILVEVAVPDSNGFRLELTVLLFSLVETTGNGNCDFAAHCWHKPVPFDGCITTGIASHLTRPPSRVRTAHRYLSTQSRSIRIRNTDEYLSYTTMQNILSNLKNWWDELNDVYSKVLQMIARRVSNNLDRLDFDGAVVLKSVERSRVDRSGARGCRRDSRARSRDRRSEQGRTGAIP